MTIHRNQNNFVEMRMFFTPLKFFHILLNVMALLALISCVTTQPSEPKPHTPKKMIEKKQVKAPESEFSFTKDEGIKQFNRLSDEIDDLSVDDHELRVKLNAKKQPSTLEEAVQYLLNIQLVLHPVAQVQQTAIKESNLDDTTKVNTETKKPLVSLTTLAEESGFNFAKALKDNPYLRDRQEIARLTLKAINTEGAALSPLSLSLRQIVTAKAESWQKLAQDFQLSSVADKGAAVATGTAAVSPVTPQVVVGEDASKPKATSTDADQALQQAQLQSERGNYLQAIAELETIAPDNADYNQAQERIVTLSNLGVKDFRTKAAQSFQSAMASYDQTAKLEYLKSAKDQLDEALKKYPKSAERGTIEANLEVIEREIDKIK